MTNPQINVAVDRAAADVLADNTIKGKPYSQGKHERRLPQSPGMSFPNSATIQMLHLLTDSRGRVHSRQR
jgi:hypothetical protein